MDAGASMTGTLGVSALDGAEEADGAFGRCRGEADVWGHAGWLLLG